MILGLTGTFAAGKGAVVEYLKEKGFVDYSSSGLLGELVEKEGNPRTRDFLSRKATELQQEYPGGVVEKNYREKYLQEKPERAIFEAIHRQSEASFLRSVGGVVIGVDADMMTRFSRTLARKEEKDQVTLEQFKDHMRVEEEGGGDASRDNNIRAVLDSADFIIQNDGSLDELHAKIDEVLASLK